MQSVMDSLKLLAILTWILLQTGATGMRTVVAEPVICWVSHVLSVFIR